MDSGHYYVLVRRSNGIPDEQIAAELHQVGGIKTLQESYGQIPRFWLDGRGPRYTWTPAVLAWQNLGTTPLSGTASKASKSRTMERAQIRPTKTVRRHSQKGEMAADGASATDGR
jgi:hypothetical protein